MLHAASLMLAFPLAGFGVLVFFGRRLGERISAIVGTVAIALSFVAAAVTFLGLMHETHRVFTQTLFNWIPVGSLQVKVALLVDPLSITMCLFITFVSALIHLYSAGYMHGDRDVTKFYVYLNLFVASMLVLVLGNNLLLTFVGWEGVGVCSYWLVSYYFDRDAAASAGKKAFVYNRIGDVGLLLAMFLIFSKVGSLDYLTIFSHTSAFSSLAVTMAVLALMLAAAGKSAQIPLFNWLPDAMEGPTPVSALIHAATMVTAGVYLLCRMNPLLALSPNARLVIAVIGGATAFVAATVATSQNDIKKVLAFSTVSQIGYMIMAVGSGAYVAAIFLMVCHAFYKALLFLGAGSVIHGLHEEQDIKRMGALRKLMPWTFITFLIGWLSIAGVPPFASFWSKGDVLDNVYRRYPALWVLGLVTALLTAYYMSRLFYLTFTGKARFSEVAPDGRPAIKTPHESPWTMRIPLVVLAVCTLGIGAIDLPWMHSVNLNHFLEPVFESRLYEPHESNALLVLLAAVDAVVAIIGVLVAWFLWRRTTERPALERSFFKNVWYWDAFYDTILGRPAQSFATFCHDVVDRKVIDGAVNGIAGVAVRGSRVLRRVQTGQVRQYALILLAGVVALLVFVLTRVL
ncbi:MAG: NADH-quinone oxidoreductase subunit L [Actinomycetes bacterium]